MYCFFYMEIIIKQFFMKLLYLSVPSNSIQQALYGLHQIKKKRQIMHWVVATAIL